MTNPSTRQHESIVIAGWGLITPLGRSAWETFASLLAGKTLADRAAQLPKTIDPVGLVRSLGSVATAVHAAADPVVELAECAAREALFMADAQPHETDCITGMSKGAMHTLIAATQRYIYSHQQASRPPTPQPTLPADADLAVTLGPHGYASQQLANRLGRTPLYNVVAACASSLTALHNARQWLLTNTADPRPSRVLVITAEAALLPLFIHSYKRLGVLPPLRPSAYKGRPLDRHREGFMLAEMGAAVVLERTAHPKPGQIELLDTAVANEPYDMIRPAPVMDSLSHIAAKLLAGRDIDLLHPHATGTPDHDPAELTTLARCLACRPDVYACKGAVGHGLGAAGLVALVLACLCAKSNQRPPMPWLVEPLPPDQAALPIKATPPPQPINTQAVFAAGFGGHVAGAVIGKH